MRKYNKKMIIAYNTGKRVGLMEAIAKFYDDNGMNDTTISQLRGVKQLYYKARQEELNSEKALTKENENDN